MKILTINYQYKLDKNNTLSNIFNILITLNIQINVQNVQNIRL